LRRAISDDGHLAKVEPGQMSDNGHRHISEPAGARRVEIFTGAGRRRRWPAESKARIVAESYAGGTTVSDVARRHGLTVPQLFAWRRQQRQVAAGTEALTGFTPVVVERALMRGGEAASVVIEMAGAVVRVPAGAAPATVATVLQALRSLP
jgi:transposase